MQHQLRSFHLLLALATPLLPLTNQAWEPVQLTPYPQKICTFFSTNAPDLPPGLDTNASPLPVGGMNVAARATDHSVWLGTTQGILRLNFSAPERDRYQYMAGRRYLRDDDVRQIVPDSEAGAWVRTASGVSHIQIKPMTLEQKAEIFERRIRERHNRYGLIADCFFTTPGDVTTHQYIDNDNDGLWTSLYVAAECFRYQITKSPEALANAKKSIDAMLFLEEVAGRRGFPARSYVRKGDRLPQGGEWHWTADGQYYWKADTSSDEIVGHFFMFSIAYDLLPDEALKSRIAATAKRIMDHILDHDYCLIDLDGKPTTWGWWSPELLTKRPDERALNSLQLLSFLKTAFHITRDPRYESEYRKVAHEFKYLDWLTRVNEFREELNYSDEELAMLPYYCVFQYERDPELLKYYRRGLDEWWKNIQREACPLWTFIYLTGQPQAKINLSPAAWTLYRTPIDMIKWTVKNSNRTDITWAPGFERAGQREILPLLPPDERPIMRWNSNPFVIDGGDNGADEDDGAAFLLPYWMGRYHGFLTGS
jgi:hypothetical protein